MKESLLKYVNILFFCSLQFFSFLLFFLFFKHIYTLYKMCLHRICEISKTETNLAFSKFSFFFFKSFIFLFKLFVIIPSKFNSIKAKGKQ